MNERYNIVTDGPVAKFYYKGSHKHPVRRTILVIEETDNLLTGYELRVGKEVRKFKKAPIQSYRKDRIANFGDYCRLKMNLENYKRLDTESTLQRTSFENLVIEGI